MSSNVEDATLLDYKMEQALILSRRNYFPAHVREKYSKKAEEYRIALQKMKNEEPITA